MIKLLPKRDHSLQSEHVLEKIKDNLCRIFAQKANIVGLWIDRQTYSVVAISMEVCLTLEEQLSKLSQHQMAVKLYRPHMDELEVIHREIEKAQPFTKNIYTNYSIEVFPHNLSIALLTNNSNFKSKKLWNSWSQLVSSIERNINEVENLIAIRDSKGITREQLNWFRISFNEFDVNRIGKLTQIQFKSCLQSLGYHFLEDDPQRIDNELKRVIDKIDPGNIGYIGFHTFLEFLTEVNLEDNRLEELIESFRTLSSKKVISFLFY